MTEDDIIAVMYSYKKHPSEYCLYLQFEVDLLDDKGDHVRVIFEEGKRGCSYYDWKKYDYYSYWEDGLEKLVKVPRVQHKDWDMNYLIPTVLKYLNNLPEEKIKSYK